MLLLDLLCHGAFHLSVFYLLLVVRLIYEFQFLSLIILGLVCSFTSVDILPVCLCECEILGLSISHLWPGSS